jgi:outer membrane protein OmpA-like peptidoglycan-associated protein
MTIASSLETTIERRALTVKSWLVKQRGIANKDLLAIGLEPKKPMASNDTA